ncbi:MAG: hypothetical protein CM15mP12_1740 [Gammaproteobacteria bacterium]|nr:MAG: hypothetical protein CM15mP12_1740 [Gammaproteobacteria bacterium]
MEAHGLNEYDAGVICADKTTAKFFEEAVKVQTQGLQLSG